MLLVRQKLPCDSTIPFDEVLCWHREGARSSGTKYRHRPFTLQGPCTCAVNRHPVAWHPPDGVPGSLNARVGGGAARCRKGAPTYRRRTGGDYVRRCAAGWSSSDRSRTMNVAEHGQRLLLSLGKGRRRVPTPTVNRRPRFYRFRMTFSLLAGQKILMDSGSSNVTFRLKISGFAAVLEQAAHYAPT